MFSYDWLWPRPPEKPKSEVETLRERVRELEAANAELITLNKKLKAALAAALDAAER